MSKTIKKILNAVNDRLGLSRLDQYFGSTENQARLITSIANEALEEFTQEQWSLLRTEGTLTMTTAETYTLPTDLRYIVADTMRANDNERFVEFPVDTEQWYYFKSRTTSSGLNYKFRIADGTLQVDNPESGQVIIYEYLTNKVVQSTGASSPDKTEFTADDDTFLLDDGLLIRYIKFKYKYQKGIEGWQLEKQEYEKYKKTHRGLEAGSRSLDFSAGESAEFPYFNRWV